MPTCTTTIMSLCNEVASKPGRVLFLELGLKNHDVICIAIPAEHVDTAFKAATVTGLRTTRITEASSVSDLTFLPAESPATAFVEGHDVASVTHIICDRADCNTKVQEILSRLALPDCPSQHD